MEQKAVIATHADLHEVLEAAAARQNAENSGRAICKFVLFDPPVASALPG